VRVAHGIVILQATDARRLLLAVRIPKD